MRSFDATLKPVISFGIPLATANPSGTLQTYLVYALRGTSGGAIDEARFLSREFASTGDLQGGQLSINAGNAALLDVAAVTALFMDYSDYDSPIGTEITVGPFIGVTMDNIATATATYIGLDDAGALVQQTSPFTNTQRRSIVSLGIAIHSNHTTINAINTLVATGRALANQFYDFMLGVFGRLNQSGNVYGPNGANLFLDKSEGRLFQPGAAFHLTPDDPHFIDLPQQTALTFAYRLRGGTQYANTTAIDPNNYDAAGVLTAVPNNRFTIQRVTVFQSGLTRIQYGQNVYNSLSDARASASSEAFETEQNIAENGILRAYLIVKKGTTSLANATLAEFIEAGKFGGTVANASAIGAAQALVSVSSAAGILTLDLSAARYFTCLLSENITSIVYTNAPPAGRGAFVSIKFTQAPAAYTVTGWPAGTLWPNGVPFTKSAAVNSVDEVLLSYYSSTQILSRYSVGFA